MKMKTTQLPCLIYYSVALIRLMFDSIGKFDGEYVPQSQPNPWQQNERQVRERERGKRVTKFDSESNIKRKTLIEIDI